MSGVGTLGAIAHYRASLFLIGAQICFIYVWKIDQTDFSALSWQKLTKTEVAEGNHLSAISPSLIVDETSACLRIGYSYSIV